MKAFYASIDTILWGRKTYDWLLDTTRSKIRLMVCSTRIWATSCSLDSRRNDRQKA